MRVFVVEGLKYCLSRVWTEGKSLQTETIISRRSRFPTISFNLSSSFAVLREPQVF